MPPRVLLIDDDKDLCEILTDLLEVAGYTVLGATDAARVLEYMEQVDPDLILVDLRMPGMDGPAFLRCYRER